MGDAQIPNDWNGVDYCEYSICWPDSPQWEAVLRGVMTIPGEGRFWDENSGNIVETQEIIEQTYSHNLANIGVLMSCSENTTNALLAIAQAIASSGCGQTTGEPDVYCYQSSNFGIQNLITIDTGAQVPLYGTQPPAILPESGYPVGYETLEDYDADKCAKVNKFVDDWETTFRNLGTYAWYQSLAGLAVLAACFVGVIVVPYAAIPTILFILLATEGLSAGFIALANYISDNREDLVCTLYATPGVEGAIIALSAFLTIAIAFISPVGAVAIALKQIALAVVSTDSLNYLYSTVAMDVYPDADCGDCEGPCTSGVEIDFSTGVSGFAIVEEDGCQEASGTPSFTAESGYCRMFATGTPSIIRCMIENRDMNTCPVVDTWAWAVDAENVGVVTNSITVSFETVEFGRCDVSAQESWTTAEGRQFKGGTVPVELVGRSIVGMQVIAANDAGEDVDIKIYGVGIIAA